MKCKQHIKFISLSVFLLLLVIRPALATDDRFQTATTAYSAGEYQLAIETFESLAEDGLSSVLLYNLANSYAQAGQTGMAILNYEKASRLAPGDSDIRGNLEHLRKEKGLFQGEQTISQRFVGLLGLDQWTVLALCGFVLLAVILLLPSSLAMKKSSRRIVAVICLLAAISASLGAYGQYLHYHDAVVVVPDARLRISPFESAASTGSIKEGRLLTPLKTHNNYVLVKDETGRTGWLASNEFMSIAMP
jgi:tetratricopeptide (TPR) repeat protein